MRDVKITGTGEMVPVAPPPPQTPFRLRVVRCHTCPTTYAIPDTNRPVVVRCMCGSQSRYEEWDR